VLCDVDIFFKDENLLMLEFFWSGDNLDLLFTFCFDFFYYEEKIIKIKIILSASF